MSEPTAQHRGANWHKSPHTWLLIYILINLVVGGFIARDYGESTDEVFEQSRAVVALNAYSSCDKSDLKEKYLSLPSSIRYYGSAQTMLFEAAERNLGAVLDARPGVVRHYGYFVSFQVAIISIYFLAGVFMSKWTSLAVSLIFGTQPLLFGHAFINPKDIPLLAIFTAVVAAGFHLSRRFEKYSPMQLFGQPRVEWKQALIEVSKQAPPKAITGLSLITTLLVLARLFASQIVAGLVSFLFNAPEGSLGEKFFDVLAANSEGGTLEAYTQKGTGLFIQALYAAALILLIGLALIFWQQLTKQGLLGKAESTGKRLPLNLYLAAVGAGAVWGYAIATRVIGLAAGGIVGLCLLLEFRRKSVLPLAAYTISAGLVCYAAWPYLWAFGFPGFIEALKVFSDFSAWSGNVLFEGQIYSAGTLPPDYMLKLIALQLTLPVVILSLAGIVISLMVLKKKPHLQVKLVLLFAWFGLPILYTVIRNTVQYGNFRQYTFILPPLFVFAGMAVEWLAAKFQRRWITPAAALVCLVPAIISLVQLHPFQYIYYNALTGGVEGAFREYALDYWLTSYMHAAEWIDENLSPGSSILVWGGDRRVRDFVENEFEYLNPNHIPPEEYDQTDYVLVTTEFHLDEEHHASGKQIFAIERDNVPLVLVLENQP
ncbi:MAG: hypothetical protein JW757_12760 [Anaerolineales bacterium]|nr:hypothetical protein [Anaerolineales bacterium]